MNRELPKLVVENKRDLSVVNEGRLTEFKSREASEPIETRLVDLSVYADARERWGRLVEVDFQQAVPFEVELVPEPLSFDFEVLFELF